MSSGEVVQQEATAWAQKELEKLKAEVVGTTVKRNQTVSTTFCKPTERVVRREVYSSSGSYLTEVDGRKTRMGAVRDLSPAAVRAATPASSARYSGGYQDRSVSTPARAVTTKTVGGRTFQVMQSNSTAGGSGIVQHQQQQHQQQQLVSARVPTISSAPSVPASPLNVNTEALVTEVRALIRELSGSHYEHVRPTTEPRFDLLDKCQLEIKQHQKLLKGTPEDVAVLNDLQRRTQALPSLEVIEASQAACQNFTTQKTALEQQMNQLSANQLHSRVFCDVLQDCIECYQNIRNTATSTGPSLSAKEQSQLSQLTATIANLQQQAENLAMAKPDEGEKVDTQIQREMGIHRQLISKYAEKVNLLSGPSDGQLDSLIRTLNQVTVESNDRILSQHSQYVAIAQATKQDQITLQRHKNGRIQGLQTLRDLLNIYKREYDNNLESIQNAGHEAVRDQMASYKENFGRGRMHQLQDAARQLQEFMYFDETCAVYIRGFQTVAKSCEIINQAYHALAKFVQTLTTALGDNLEKRQGGGKSLEEAHTEFYHQFRTWFVTHGEYLHIQKMTLLEANDAILHLRETARAALARMDLDAPVHDQINAKLERKAETERLIHRLTEEEQDVLILFKPTQRYFDIHKIPYQHPTEELSKRNTERERVIGNRFASTSTGLNSTVVSPVAVRQASNAAMATSITQQETIIDNEETIGISINELPPEVREINITEHVQFRGPRHYIEHYPLSPATTQITSSEGGVTKITEHFPLLPPSPQSFDLAKFRLKLAAKNTQPPAEFLCPLSKEIMEDPVRAADNHTYDRKAITEWLKRSSLSPVTRQPMRSVYVSKDLDSAERIRKWVIEQCMKHLLPFPNNISYEKIGGSAPFSAFSLAKGARAGTVGVYQGHLTVPDVRETINNYSMSVSSLTNMGTIIPVDPHRQSSPSRAYFGGKYAPDGIPLSNSVSDWQLRGWTNPEITQALSEGSLSLGPQTHAVPTSGRTISPVTTLPSTRQVTPTAEFISQSGSQSQLSTPKGLREHTPPISPRESLPPLRVRDPSPYLPSPANMVREPTELSTPSSYPFPVRVSTGEGGEATTYTRVRRPSLTSSQSSRYSTASAPIVGKDSAGRRVITLGRKANGQYSTSSSTNAIVQSGDSVTRTGYSSTGYGSTNSYSPASYIGGGGWQRAGEARYKTTVSSPSFGSYTSYTPTSYATSGGTSSSSNLVYL